MIRIKGQVHFFRVTNANRARAGAFDEVAIDQRLQLRHKFQLGSNESGRQVLRHLAAREVRPDCADLLFRVAAQKGFIRRHAVRPELGHPRAGPQLGGIEEVASKPIGRQPLRRRGEVQGGDAERRVSGKHMTRDAVQPFAAHKSQAIPKNRIGGDRVAAALAPIRLLKGGDEWLYIRHAKLRHPRGHVRADAGAVEQNLFQPRRLQLGANPIQVRRERTFLAEIGRAIDFEIRAAQNRGSHLAVAAVAGVTIEGRHRVAHLIGGREWLLERGQLGQEGNEFIPLLGRERKPRCARSRIQGQTTVLTAGQFRQRRRFALRWVGIVTGRAVVGFKHLPALCCLDAIQDKGPLVRELQKLSLVGQRQRGPRDFLLVQTRPGPGNLQHWRPDVVKVSDHQVVVAGGESDLPFLHRWFVNAVIVHHLLGINEQLRAVP